MNHYCEDHHLRAKIRDVADARLYRVGVRRHSLLLQPKQNDSNGVLAVTPARIEGGYHLEAIMSKANLKNTVVILSLACCLAVFTVATTRSLASPIPQSPEPLKLNFQKIDSSLPYADIFRSKVPGGWLVMSHAVDHDTVATAAGLTFIPDPQHTWTGDSATR